MFRVVYALLILAVRLRNTFAVGLKQVNDEGHLRRIVSVLQGISKQLATEREKEDVVFDEIKRFCKTTDDATDSEHIKHNHGTPLDDDIDVDHDEGAPSLTDDDAAVAAPHMMAQAAGGHRSVVLSDSPQFEAKVVAMVPSGQPLTLVSDYVADGDYVKVRWDHTTGYTKRTNVVPATDGSSEETFRASKGVHNVADEVTVSAEISALKPHDHSIANTYVNIQPHAGPINDAPKAAKRVFAMPPHQKGEPQMQKVASDMVEIEDPSKDLEQMQALLDGPGSEEVPGSEGARTTKKVAHARVEAVGATPKELSAPPVANRLDHDEEQTVSQHVDQDVMNASEEQLASIIKESVDLKDQNVMTARSEPASSFQPDQSLDSIFAADSAVADTEPLGNPMLSVDAIEDDESKRAAFSAEPKPLEHAPVTAIGQAVQSEFDETSDLVASMEKDDLAPNKRIAKKANSKVQPHAGGDVNVATVSAALDDLGGAIPSIDQQALELYNANGGESATLDKFGGLVPAPAFLQLGRRQQQFTKLKVVAVSDLNSAWDALQVVAEDTKSALSMMESLRKTGWGQADPAARPEADSDEQCTVLIQRFSHRQEVRAGHEAKLTKHSQHLLHALGHSHAPKAKYLRSQL